MSKQTPNFSVIRASAPELCETQSICAHIPGLFVNRHTYKPRILYHSSANDDPGHGIGEGHVTSSGGTQTHITAQNMHLTAVTSAPNHSATRPQAEVHQHRLISNNRRKGTPYGRIKRHPRTGRQKDRDGVLLMLGNASNKRDECISSHSATLVAIRL